MSVPQSPNKDTAPPVQRLRVQYAKRGRLRFSSARDFQRALERALRRAQVPMAYTGGFSPHPRISYANAAATGVASEAEYVELALVERCDPRLVGQVLDDSLPPGLDIVDVVEARTPDFTDRLEASIWRIELPLTDVDVAGSATRAFLDADEILVERTTKSGRKTLDARSAVLSVTVGAPDTGAVEPDGDCAILTVVVRHGTPSVRPDDILSALQRVAGLVPPRPARVTRLAQGPLDATGTAVTDPLGPDREAPDRGAVAGPSAG